ncbi:MAG TPA: hypothetical protein VJ827_05360 [Rubrobacter sp.]|nr:hypothetical protein [Rubrobacter sp.]
MSGERPPGYDLPKGYEVTRDPDVLTLAGPNRRIIGHFTPGTPPSEVSLAAYRHAYEVQRTLGELQRLLTAKRGNLEKTRGQCYPAAGLR